MTVVKHQIQFYAIWKGRSLNRKILPPVIIFHGFLISEFVSCWCQKIHYLIRNLRQTNDEIASVFYLSTVKCFLFPIIMRRINEVGQIFSGFRVKFFKVFTCSALFEEVCNNFVIATELENFVFECFMGNCRRVVYFVDCRNDFFIVFERMTIYVINDKTRIFRCVCSIETAVAVFNIIIIRVALLSTAAVRTAAAGTAATRTAALLRNVVNVPGEVALLSRRIVITGKLTAATNITAVNISRSIQIINPYLTKYVTVG